jgi:hypothetical protein
MAKLDIKKAYLQVPIRAADHSLLAFEWDHGWYKCRALMFGLCNAVFLFTKLMKPVVRELRRTGVRCLIYLDDLLLVGRTRREACTAVRKAQALLEALGWIINIEKSVLVPTQQIRYLGLLVDTVRMQIIAPPDKCRTTRKDAAHALSDGGFRGLRHLQRFRGYVESFARAVRGTHTIMRPLQRLLLRATYPRPARGWIPLDHETRVALQRWVAATRLYNGVPLHQPTPSLTLTTDASETGWGAVLSGAQSARGGWPPRWSGQHINRLELRAIREAIYHYADRLAGRAVRLQVDSLVALWYIRRGGGSRPALSRIAEEICLWCLDNGCTLLPQYVPSRWNEADALSRGGVLGPHKRRHLNWELSWPWFNRINRRWGPLWLDLFAAEWNRKLPRFCSLFPHPEATAVDAFSLSWKGRAGLYANPPSASWGGYWRRSAGTRPRRWWCCPGGPRRPGGR